MAVTRSIRPEDRGRWFVVKIGGELAMDKARLARSVGGAVAEFLAQGIRVALVHGGGPQATLLTKKLGLEPKLVAGRRYTDAETLEVMKMTLAGQVSVDVASAFRMAKVPVLATTGVSAKLIEATRRPPRVITGAGPDPIDLGLVGGVTRVNVGAFEALAQAGFVPLIASLAADDAGDVFNINADTVASEVAGGLGAARLFLISNVPGVLGDKDDPKSRIPVLTPERAEACIHSGVIYGGMIPKVEESMAMLRRGVGAVHVLGVEPEDALLREAAEPGSCGTVFRPN